MTTPTRGRRSPRALPVDTLTIPDAVGAPVDPRRPALPPLPTRQRVQRRPRSIWPVAAVVTTFAAMVLYAYGSYRPKTDDLPAAGILMLPALLAVTALIVTPATKKETRFDLRGIMLLGFALRGFGAYFRFSAPADALIYHREGTRLADELRSFNFFFDTGRPIPGTGWIRYVSAVTHAYLIDDMFATFMIFMFLGFMGTYLMYRAFAHAVPDGDHRRYALLLFLWPTLIFWPSSIGKEAWMILGLGVAAWGVSRLLTGIIFGGVVSLILGLVILSMVRPHIALMILAGFAISLLARPVKSSSVRFFGRMISIALVLVGGALIAGRTAEVLKIDNTGTEGVNLAYEETVVRTEQGGAAFKPAVVRSPVDYPLAFATVWFRPFPWEAKGGGGEGASTQLVTAAENLVLLGLCARSWRRLVGLPRLLLRVPYVTFAATYSIVFVYAFSAIGNFGILARQRTQGIIFFFVILCTPVAQRVVKSTAQSTRGLNVGRARRALASLRRAPRAPS